MLEQAEPPMFSTVSLSSSGISSKRVSIRLRSARRHGCLGSIGLYRSRGRHHVRRSNRPSGLLGCMADRGDGLQAAPRPSSRLGACLQSSYGVTGASSELSWRNRWPRSWISLLVLQWLMPCWRVSWDTDAAVVACYHCIRLVLAQTITEPPDPLGCSVASARF